LIARLPILLPLLKQTLKLLGREVDDQGTAQHGNSGIHWLDR